MHVTTPARDGSRVGLLVAFTAAAVIAVALAVVGVFALSRADANPTPTPTPTVSALPSPSASSPTPPVPTTDTTAPTVSRLVFAATGFDLQDEDGADVFVHEWADPGADAVAALSDAFGSEPTQSVREGDGTHFSDYAVYAWPGFTFFDSIPAEGGRPREEYQLPSYVEYAANEVAGIAVTTEFGLRIGMPIGEVRTLAPDSEWRHDTEPYGVTFTFAQERSRIGEHPISYTVYVETDPGGEVVERISYSFHSEL